MKNNKGYTLVELLVSFSLIMIVMIYLIRTIVVLSDKNNELLKLQEYSVYENILLNKVYKDIDTLYDRDNLRAVDNTGSVTFSELSKTMEFDTTNKTISYGGIMYALPDYVEFRETPYTLTKLSEGYLLTINLKIDKRIDKSMRILYYKNHRPKENNPKQQDFAYSGRPQVFTAPKYGTYKIELWGAQGGSTSQNKGGKGAYTKGNIFLKKGEKLYVYIGGNNGYNGGGSLSGELEYSTVGGGSTDVRLVGGSWDNSEGLASRIMVAGAGGGAYSYPDSNFLFDGAAAGTLTGLSGTANNTCISTGGTQTSGGTCSSNSSVSGSFGHGGNGSSGRASGGGSGYYGGSGRYDAAGSGSGAGGGSSYISGYTGSVAITSASDITPKAGCSNGTSDIACSYHYSNKIFTDAIMKAGNEEMPSRFDDGLMTGNEGNGFARITLVDETQTDFDYDYTGHEEVLTVPYSGTYKIETWGAQGGNSTYNNASYEGGYGAYSTGTIDLIKDEQIYINVGGQGGGFTANNSTATADSNTGYNGGGYGGATPGNSTYAGGGGATHISFKSGLLRNLSDDVDDIIIVSSGGGGSGAHASAPSYSGQGGHGGGIKGNNGVNGTCYSLGLGATQTAAGGHQTCSSDGHTYGSHNTAVFTGESGFGYGASYSEALITSGNAYRTDAGGGSGLYGGGSAWHSSGGGGSSYIGNELLSDKHMTCYNCSTSNEEDTKTNSVTSVSSSPISDQAKKGNGYARISLVQEKEVVRPQKIESTFNYTGNAQTFTAPESGNYKIEAWGASGATKTGTNKGAYTSGIIGLTQGSVLYIYVGEQGNITRTVAFNGGGKGGLTNSSSSNNIGSSGGGATDIRLVNGSWDNAEGLASRIMVAGGSGGGTVDVYESAGENSIGGALIGGSGGYYSGHSYVNQNGKGGTQIEGGSAGNNHFSATGTNNPGTFGIGGDSGSTSDEKGAGGGGGGYYGGGAGGSTLSGGSGQGGGGGSSYISGHKGCIAITSASDLTQRTDSSGSTCSVESAATDSKCSEHYSGKVFSSTVMKAGNEEMPTHNGKSTMTGNSGNGYVKITLIRN
ncbi:MAG: prepilin-type N-terminal cleavage/methylation domain-containing protein [Bacilli bacterium]|nr:prepilin-type N-terminal cleavage/methylation domain-containing protein [Bacilli bacterium]